MSDNSASEGLVTIDRAELKKLQSQVESLKAKLQHLAVHDPMTGCLNRLAFFESLKHIWKASRGRYDDDLSCIMVDLDDFRQINEIYGVAVGDEVLSQVAESLRNKSRDSDLVCRFGSEEFSILLPNIAMEGAKSAAERYRTAIEELDFGDIKVTASLGCSDVRQEGCHNPQRLLEQANLALWHAQRTGQNRSVRYDALQIEMDIELPSIDMNSAGFQADVEKRLRQAENLMERWLDSEEEFNEEATPSMYGFLNTGDFHPGIGDSATADDE